MCGIAGFYNFANKNITREEALLHAMQEKLVHRGPDDHGVWLSEDKRVGLAHRRLSIIDLSCAGKQPMHDKNHNVIVSFNGEIYNHRILRKELENRGYKYFSQTDTETLIYAYQEWGINFIHKLDGMFAIALYDIKRDDFYLIRDRIGIKPLYFSVQNNILSFASEIKALWVCDWNKKEISPQALYHYLTFMITPAPYTIFKDVYKLPAGFYMHVHGARDLEFKDLTFKEWYSPLTTISTSEKKEFANEQFCLENIKSLLINSTKKRMMSDVPFGAFLSGGVDSSLNVALMSEFVSNVKTFTVTFSDGPEFDELKWARLVAKKFDTEHHEIIISEKEAFEFYERMVYHLDEPLADCVCIPFYYVAKCARDAGVTVVQVGEGADELFFGYPTYANYKSFYDTVWAPAQRFIPAFLRKSAYKISRPFLSKHSSHAEVLKNWAYDRGLFWGGAVAFNEHQKRKVLDLKLFQETFSEQTGHNLRDRHDPIVRKIFSGMKQEYDSFALVDYHMSRVRDHDFGAQMLYLELKQRLPELLLMRTDKMAMATSIEARVPFLDHKLVEFMLHVPISLKFKNNTTKYLLKQVARDYLPEEIITRKKMGFAAPTTRWFNGGKYFPAYFKTIQKQRQKVFNDQSHDIANLFVCNAASESVKKWVLQNIWAFSHERQ